MKNVIRVAGRGAWQVIEFVYNGSRAVVCRVKPKKKYGEAKINGAESALNIADENTKIRFSEEVLDEFRENVGKYPAETGGMIASKVDESVIDTCYFDTLSKNTSGSFYYDVESMTKVYHEWKNSGYVVNGIYHSHPIGFTRLSYHDVSSALLHIEFFGLDYLYMPIIQSDKRGLYTLYLYVVRKEKDKLTVTLESVVKALEEGYEYPEFKARTEEYSLAKLRGYRDRVDGSDRDKAKQEEQNVKPTSKECFKKVETLFNDNVRNKVIVCVGVGGARSFLENMARCGFKNFILMDKDTVSPSNVATQGVFISEMGEKKVEVIKKRLEDINPDARVVCVDRFLDDDMSDKEFEGYLKLFPGRKATDYLILGCTDNFDAQERCSLLALKYGTPYLAAMMYKNGVAAELMFTYPSVTESCPRCVLRQRYEMYEQGFENDVDSSACTVFATEYMNALKGHVALALLCYNEVPGSEFNDWLDKIKSRNFVQMRLSPNARDVLGMDIFDRAHPGTERFAFMGDVVWIPQWPDNPEHGSEPCKLCGGRGNLAELKMKWADTRRETVKFKRMLNGKKSA